MPVAVAVLEGITAVLPGRARSRAHVRRRALDRRLGLLDGLVGVGTDVCLGVGVGDGVALGGAAVLVDLERVDSPVGLLEVGGVVPHVIVAGAGLGGAGAGGPGVTGPVAAEGDIEDDLQLVEVRVDVTVATTEAGGGGPPARRVRAAAGDVGRDAGVGEEPDVDIIAGPLGSVDTATGLVEAVTVGLGAAIQDGTARVGSLARGLDVAVAGGDGAGEARAADGAAITSVQGHLVGGLGVGTLDDVNLAVVWPAAAKHPARKD